MYDVVALARVNVGESRRAHASRGTRTTHTFLQHLVSKAFIYNVIIMHYRRHTTHGDEGFSFPFLNIV